MKIVAKIKQTARDHKPEIIAFSVTVAALTAGAYMHRRMKNFVEFNDDVVAEIKEHGYLLLHANNEIFQVTNIVERIQK
jgi:hypothetical protein